MVVNRVGFFLMKKKLHFKSKISLLKKIENMFGKSEIFFCKIIKNVLFENKKLNRNVIETLPQRYRKITVTLALA